MTVTGKTSNVGIIDGTRLKGGGSSGPSQLVSSSTLSLDSSGFARIYPSASAQLQQLPQNRSSRISDSCSVGGNESVYSTTSHNQHYSNNLQYSRHAHHLGSSSLTPPPSKSRNVVQLRMAASKSRLDSMDQEEVLNREIENLDEDDTDAFADLLPPNMLTATATASIVAHHSSGTACSSPASSTSMLPPPVFSHKFERILAPEPPPSVPPPPVPHQPIKVDSVINLRATVMDNNALKSMSSDSGIGTETMAAHAAAAAALAANADRPVLRAHSMKVKIKFKKKLFLLKNK